MGWKYEPPAPDTEATNMLSAYKERLRGAEARDQFEVNRDTKPTTPSRFNLGRLRNVASLISTRLRGARR